MDKINSDKAHDKRQYEQCVAYACGGVTSRIGLANGGVKFMTAYVVKDMDFPHVFVCGMGKSIFSTAGPIVFRMWKRTPISFM